MASNYGNCDSGRKRGDSQKPNLDNCNSSSRNELDWAINIGWEFYGNQCDPK